MELKQIYEERRSVNFFDKNKEISDEKLKEIIDLAVLAPSAYNLQPWRIIAVKTDDAKEKLYEFAKQEKIKESSVNLIIIGDRGAYKDRNPMWKIIEEKAGKKVDSAKKGANYLYGSTEERSIKFAESNAGLLSMSIMYAAKSLGIDSHPMNGIDFAGIKENFKLIDDEDVVMIIALGYHNKEKKLHGRGYRRGFEEIVEVI